MSKFQSTVSTVAALVSIFGAAAAGYKLAQQPNQKPEESPPAIEQKLTQLEQKIEEKLTTAPQQPLQQAPITPQLPQTAPLPPPPIQPSEVQP